MKDFLIWSAIFTVAFVVGWAVGDVHEWLQEPTATLPAEDEEYCLIDILDSAGGQIVSNTAGEDTYRIIATQRGYEVYQKCAKN